MKRRTAIRNLGLVTGGLFLLPSCNFSEERVPLVLSKLKITTEEEILLEAMIDTILPETDTPGGVSLKVQNFVWTMLDDCASPEQQASFLNGLRGFNASVKEKHGDNFVDMDKKERLATLQNLMDDETLNKDLSNFLHTTKHTAVWGYKNTEYYMTQLMPYKLIPGAFSYRTKTIDPNEKININA
ncbi:MULTISPECIES: gluconate 2-dehydrogenase subunit 3 family protein [Galbibacter]|uniref:Gluconate 2-dehydrogenase subunit 3 family protein n=1 Tax=Galbibacter pacificus TaxID=2996052 RepID=A0ABT6FU84_9FLAO|nr:gluconate 2-dehydrogenase subunit 3 family protein [Galbibacter pacificus]MDG3583357.1 gluconate 2-dehydrogenase subunit 3 family protein [Galbibacter pacificus]MDG3586838.1 gluconate 2-dehydrogenase subunit 3 family protein [Galbibacter pacificus]